MSKQTIITILLSMVALIGHGQTFTPIVEDSVDFVITGTTTSPYDSLVVFPCAPHGQRVEYPVVDGQFKVTGRLPRHTFIQIGELILSLVKPRVVNCNRSSSNVRCVNEPLKMS